jgi:hypothetical protein
MARRGRSAGPKARATSRFNKFCESATCRSITSVQPGSGLVRTSAVAEEGGLGNALRGSLSDRLRLTTGLLTSSLSASSSAEGQSIAWRAPAEVTMSRTARRAGSPRPPARAWPGHDAKQPCWLPRAVGQASADARARPADERLTADGKRAGRKPGASCAAALDNTGRPRRARCARAGHRAAVTIHSTATARSLMGLYRSPAMNESPTLSVALGVFRLRRRVRLAGRRRGGVGVLPCRRWPSRRRLESWRACSVAAWRLVSSSIRCLAAATTGWLGSSCSSRRSVCRWSARRMCSCSPAAESRRHARARSPRWTGRGRAAAVAAGRVPRCAGPWTR